jgi:O-acetyl-ADP-ribose deacetylase (regulator of RNase III)
MYSIASVYSTDQKVDMTASARSPIDPEFAFQLRDVRVVVVPSSITEAAAGGGFDAIVSSDDTSLAMAAGVANDIRRVAGESVADEAARRAPVRLGEVVVTSGGRLPLQYVFHAIITDLQRGIAPTHLTIRSLARSIFRRCEDLHVKRLGLPSIIVNAEGVVDRATHSLVEALAEHVSQPTQLQEVVFCIPDAPHREAFISALLFDLTSELPDAATSFAWPSSRETGDSSSDASPGPTVDSVRVGFPRPSQSLVGAIASAIRRWRARNAVVGSPERYSMPGPEASAPASRSVFTRTVTPDEALEAVDRVATIRNRTVLHQRYVLLEEIGRGGMGIVHLAWDLVLRQTVAIKTLRPSVNLSARHIDRLRQEAALQMRMTHAGIVRLFHFEPGASAGPFLVMEYVPWLTAEQWIAEAGSEGLPPRAVLHVGERLCDALASAHDAGVLHLDIKPSNVFVDPAGEQPKLADFGIATSIGPTGSDVLVTRLVGTPAYMAPEQTTRGAKIGPWTDVYLLAGTLWELITGRKASEPNDCAEPETVAALAVLRRGLAESTEQRPRSVKVFQSLLARAFEDVLPA